MTNTTNNVPKLGLLKLSSYFADLLLVGAGEEEAVKHPRTRSAWHLFFFSLLSLLAWHGIVRMIVIPNVSNVQNSDPIIRLIEAVIYSYLLIVLTILMYRHYHFMLLPRRDPRFVTIGFFFIMMLLLFSRLNYSLYHFDTNLFQWENSTILPSSEFGIHGYEDIGGIIEFLIFSGCAMLNCSYSSIQSNSLLISSIALIQSFVGFVFIAILVATVIELSLTPSHSNHSP
jgi:hypothetical protein